MLKEMGHKIRMGRKWVWLEKTWIFGSSFKSETFSNYSNLVSQFL